MFRQSKASEIGQFFDSKLTQNELALYYLGVSGFIVRTANNAAIIDPAGLLKGDEIKTLKDINLILFTHNHLDHFSSGKTQEIFRATNAAVLAEAKVADKLKGKIPTEKLTKAESGKTYTFGNITASAVEGIHRGPIMLYQIKMDGATVFHGGDSGYVNLKEYSSQAAIVPVGRMSPTASPENAFKMVSDLKPEIAITMHGSDKQKQQFEQKVKEALPQTEVIIIKQYTWKTLSLREGP